MTGNLLKTPIEVPYPIACEYTSGENGALFWLFRVLGMASDSAGEISPQSSEPRKTLLFKSHRLL